MQRVTVLYVDYVSKVRRPIGTVTERRQTSRPENLTGLLQIARKAFSSSPQEAFHVALDPNSLPAR